VPASGSQFTGLTPILGMHKHQISGGGMRTFRQFLASLREQGDELGLGDLGSENAEEVLLRIANHVIRLHREDFVSMAENLAEKDDRLKEELRAYRQAEKSGGRASIKHPPNKRSLRPEPEQLAPNSADMGGGHG
jgi:hypothetical protein